MWTPFRMTPSSTPSSSASKRETTDQGADTAAPVVVESWSSFFNAPDADVILRSVDGRLFATRKAFLVAASSVFDDMFTLPQSVDDGSSVRKQGQAAPDVLQVVEMAEKGDELELFLRWIHRGTFKDVRDEADKIYDDDDALPLVLSLLKLASKFNVPSLPPLIVQALSWPNGAVSYIDQVAVGVIHDMSNVVADALLRLNSVFDIESDAISPDVNNSAWNPRLELVHKDWRPSNVSDIESSLCRLLPLGFFRSFAAFESAMLHRKDFEIHAEVDTFLESMKEGFPILDD